MVRRKAETPRHTGGANKAELTERRIRAWELALQGKSYRVIGEALGVAPMTAFRDVEAHAREIQQPVAEQVRKQEVARLDALLDNLWPRVEQGDDKAVANVLRVMDRRAKLLGLDAPAKQDITVQQVDPKDIELAELIREAQAKAAANVEELRRTDAVQE